jgi:hypothetical protein
MVIGALLTNEECLVFKANRTPKLNRHLLKAGDKKLTLRCYRNGIRPRKEENGQKKGHG